MVGLPEEWEAAPGTHQPRPPRPLNQPLAGETRAPPQTACLAMFVTPLPVSGQDPHPCPLQQRGPKQKAGQGCGWQGRGREKGNCQPTTTR